MRITIFSPKAVGSVDRRISTSRRRGCGLDAAVLRAPLLDHVHAAEQLDARGHRACITPGHLVDGVQHAVDAKADHAHLAPRLEVDVAGALVEGVLPQPVDHLHHALVVGVELLVAAAQLHQLLEARQRGGLAGLGGRAHRARQRVELGGVARNVERVGHHQLASACACAPRSRPPSRCRRARRWPR
jgi:hypothetical protein